MMPTQTMNKETMEKSLQIYHGFASSSMPPQKNIGI